MTRPIHILLVEDNPADVRFAQEVLRESKFTNRMEVIGDGEAALAYLRREGPYADAERPDIVLLDVNLPKRDGLEVLAELAKDEKLRTLPVAVLTASKMDQQILRTYNLHVDCFITKPLDVERFLDAVRCFDHLALSIVSTASA